MAIFKAYCKFSEFDIYFRKVYLRMGIVWNIYNVSLALERFWHL
jgi:hypothetical protein